MSAEPVSSDPQHPKSVLDLYFLELQKREAQPTAAKIASPHGLTSQTLSKIFGENVIEMAESLAISADALKEGDLTGLEGTLSSQAIALNAMFHRLAQVSFEKPRTAVEFAAYFKLALRAQAQSAAAMEILANLKQGPKILITRQLNTAHQQVVNNHPEHSGPAPERNCSAKKPASARRRALPRKAGTLASVLPPNTQSAKSYAPLER